MAPVVDFQIICEEVERNSDDKYENVQKKEDSRGHIRSDNVPLHSVNVRQFAKETKPVVNQSAHPFRFFRKFADSRKLKVLVSFYS